MESETNLYTNADRSLPTKGSLENFWKSMSNHEGSLMHVQIFLWTPYRTVLPVLLIHYL